MAGTKADLWLRIQFTPPPEEPTSYADVYTLSGFIAQSPSSKTANATFEDSDSSSSSADDEFVDALTGDEYELKCSPVEDQEYLTFCSIEERQAWIQSFWEGENSDEEYTDTHPDEKDNTPQAPAHPLAGLHSPRLARSNWTDHSFIDRADHIDVWARHTDLSLGKCTWCVYPESDCPKPPKVVVEDKDGDAFWGAPTPEAPEAPELRLITPEGEVCWIDDPTCYEGLP